MQEIKLIVSDIDGTLIDSKNKTTTIENVRAINRARELGVQFTLATGRAFVTARKWMTHFGVTMPIITCNGAEIADEQKIYYSRRFPESEVREIVLALEEEGARKFVVSAGKIYCQQNEPFDFLLNLWNDGGMKDEELVLVKDANELIEKTNGNVQKILGWADDRERFERMMNLEKKFGDRFEVVNSLGNNCEFIEKGATKGDAIKRLCEMEGIELRNVLAIGDAENDVHMLEMAGIGVAVANAMPKARQAADFMTDSCKESGVANAIKRFVLDEKTEKPAS